ncbi:unnamed protein product [Thelazia callipaeda]|uniref:HTH CENPB-type domain-containing protein n=1 Tax=Thelazia callipaeda TaxID=103827 RepID=A0A0N5CW08_THECL|nr:unnamed protein product [Thelazia callipaeda]
MLPSTSFAPSTSSHNFVSESMQSSQQTTPTITATTTTATTTSSLVQLLNSPKATRLYRPTPIHPLASGLILSTGTKLSELEADHEVPLDLSQPATTLGTSSSSSASVSAPSPSVRQQSVIKTQRQKTFLPTCANPNLDSNWIAIKFGPSVGPNRMSYPREFKLMVVNYYYTNGQNKYRTCKEFQITKSMLNGWLQKIDKIQQSRPGSLKSGRSGRKPQFPDIEKQLFHLYHAHLERGKKVGNRWIRETARDLARQQCSERELAGMCQFSERWLSNFKKRYKINLNRDWSSGNSSFGSNESVGSSSSATGSLHPSPTKSDEAAENESMDSDVDSILSDSLETLIDVEDQTSSQNRVPTTETFPTTQEHIQEILNKPGQLPIQAFYERFPWLCRKNHVGAEPGRRGRKVQFPGVEKVLFERLQQQQSKGERISNRWLQQQARELALQICPEVLKEATKSARCLFSEHWLHNFKKRYGVTLKQNNGNRNLSNAPSNVTSGITSSAYALQYDSSPTSSSDLSLSNTAKSATDLTTVLHLQNWFLTKYYGQEQGTNTSATQLDGLVSTSAHPVWYPTPLTQCLL